MKDIRTRLIEATYEEVFSNGYTGASLANILKRADTKKGSLYHHFSSKKEMVISMIKEKIEKRIEKKWEVLTKCDQNIIEHLINVLKDTDAWDLTNGCPLGNLLQESLNQDEDFAKSLTQILDMWKELLSNVLTKAVKNKELKEDIEVEKVATFLIATIEGALLLAKKHENDSDFNIVIEQLIFYINSLRN